MAGNVLDEVSHPLTGGLTSSPELQILDAIIGAITIDVVDILALNKWATEVLLHHDAVLTSASDVDVAIVRDSSRPGFDRRVWKRDLLICSIDREGHDARRAKTPCEFSPRGWLMAVEAGRDASPPVSALWGRDA